MEQNQGLEKMEEFEITEIGCMCRECDCKQSVLIAVAICDSCLKNQH